MNVQRLQALRRAQKYHLLPIKAGMMVEIHEKIGEGSNQRIWKFKWLVIKVKKPNHADGTFTLRGKTSGHTIEKIYPLSFVNFDHVYLLDVYKVARAKLYYIRDKIGKDAKMKSLITAEQRGIDLLVIAKENLANELPAVLQEIADDTQIDEATADAIVAENEPEVAPEEIVTEVVATEEPVIEQTAQTVQETTEEEHIEELATDVSPEEVTEEVATTPVEETPEEEKTA
jgi:large subunit ribosomal protein L19